MELRKIIRHALSEHEFSNSELKTFPERKDWEPRWVYEKDYASKKRSYVNDTIEYLTGFFGINSSFNRTRLDIVVGNIFDATMKDIYHHGVKLGFNQAESIARNVLGKGYDDDDVQNVIAILEMQFSGE
jgi:hypothetical protein